MGIDAEIYFKTTDGEDPSLEWYLPNGFTVVAKGEDDYGPEDATHEIDNCVRYYGEGYERGPWPMIAETLMLLLACPSVEMVWYGGDHSSALEECTPEKVLQLTEYFMANGNRPHRS